ncbi:MAG: adenylate/guanylate cyclase domain-containing protein [Sphingomonadales bacterium]|jgi:class 3 adenylate cyclase
MDNEIIKNVLQAMDQGVAIADADDWKICFENARFFKWFSDVEKPDENLQERLKGLDKEKALSRLDKGRDYSFETEVKQGPRTISLKVSLSHMEIGGKAYIVAECANVSKQREAEYMLDSYAKMAEKNARDLNREKERVEKLLLNIMPRSVYEELKDYGTTTPQKFDSASVLMLDFVDFTEMSVSRDPGALIAELNDIFSAFDRIVELFECERIKTIGDAYVAVSGLPDPNPDHVNNIARVALRMKRYLERRNEAHPNNWRFRIGIASGPLIGSMVGIQKYVYDIFGPAVNLAARMESLCEPMKITITGETKSNLTGEFSTKSCGVHDIKGFGEMELFTLEFEQRR